MARSFYIIGGTTVIERFELTEGGSTIARFDTTTLSWSLAGQLNTGRAGHGVIQQGLKFLVVGGQKPGHFDLNSESCQLTTDNFTCTDQTASFYGYSYWPMLFFVDESYEKC